MIDISKLYLLKKTVGLFYSGAISKAIVKPFLALGNKNFKKKLLVGFF